jgi:polysaccharide export outer membrane protein
MGSIGSGAGTLAQASPQAQYQTYLVDSKGEISFPVIGSIKMGGLTRTEAVEKLKSELEKYVKNPIVNLRIVNYKVSVFGEVLRPGTYNIRTERVTLPEVISMAGDMTIYGSRNNVLVIREENGQKTHSFIDMTQADFINSPYYYLTQNDQVYIEPNKTRINSAAVGPNIAVGISALSLIITIIALVTN